jgi:hypothetical protein
MQPRTKIRLDGISRAQKLLEAAPPPELEEVTKSHAVRILVPQIRDAQSKGYSLQTIAKMLSESGVSVSASLLKTLLSEASSKRVRGRNTGHEPGRKQGGVSSGARGAPRQEPAPAASIPKIPTNQAPAATPAGSRTRDGTGVRTGSAPTSQSTGQPYERRSSFVPRPDTENI